jgi:magnesium-transporting ATPase (P-type)
VPFIRLIALVAAVALGISVLMYLLTGRPGWRRLAWRVVIVAGAAVGLVLLLLLLEHLLGPA